MSKKTLVTAALLYANGPLHFGHLAGAYIPADCFARFRRMQGDDLLFVSGSDAYGIAITLSAEKAGRSPTDHVTLFHNINKKLFEKMNISFDHYSNTICKSHSPLVKSFFLNLVDNGFVDKKVIKRLYSEEEGRFFADRYVRGECPKCNYEFARGDECTSCGASYEAEDLKNPVSAISGGSLVLRDTLHWFLKLDSYKDKLKTWLKGKEWKEDIVKFLYSSIEGLKSRGISRDLSWGIDIPGKDGKGKVFYVWFDAPIGYISATHDFGGKDAVEKYWLDSETSYYQFIGKDNLFFHGIFFPLMVMGQNCSYKQVDKLISGNFLQLEGRQFSKSDGWFIDLDSFLDKYCVDTLRYYLASRSPENQDSEFSWKDFQLVNNVELVGKFGNFVHRTLSFVKLKMNGKISLTGKSANEVDTKFVKDMYEIANEVKEYYDQSSLRKATSAIISLSSLGNVYFDKKKPWTNPEDLDITLHNCIQCIRVLSIIASPIIPKSCRKIYKMLSLPYRDGLWKEIEEIEKTPVRVISEKPKVLFKKIEDKTMENELSKLGKPSTSNKSNKPEEILYKDFAKLDLCVGEILDAEEIVKSDKLLKLCVDVSGVQRTIVSGIKVYYPNYKDLIGLKVIVVANLKTVELMGVKSEGMILSTEDNSHLKLVTLSGVKSGAKVL